jgi:RHS repeat-associated protein
MPYGEEIVSPQRTQSLGYTADTIRQKFTGYERDAETALDFAKARFSAYWLGRFTSADPIQIQKRHLADPRDFNRFAYVANNPLLYFDPSGEEKIIIYIRTFIPEKTVTTPTGRVFEGDNRKAGDNPDRYRTIHRIEIETDPTKNGGRVLIGEPTGATGVTRELDSNGEIVDEARADGKSLRQNAERFNIKIGNFDPVVVVTASGDESNPLVTGAPAITYQFYIGIGSQGADKPLVFHIGGTVDGFPAYEVTIVRPEASDASERLVWSYDPSVNGNGPMCLIDYYCDEKVEFSGTTP